MPVPESAPQSTSRTLDSMELSLSLNEKSSLLDNYKGGSLDVDSLIQRLVWSFIFSLSLSLSVIGVIDGGLRAHKMYNAFCSLTL